MPQYNPQRFALATVVGAIPGLLAHRRVLKALVLGRARKLVAAVVIGVVTSAACAIMYLVLHATDGFPGPDEHPIEVAAFMGLCFGIASVLFRGGMKFTLRKREPGS